MERYRSGHNEAVLKTVCPKGHVGSNPTLSVFSLGDVPKRLKGLPWKGSRSLVAARGFKSLHLRTCMRPAVQGVCVEKYKVFRNKCASRVFVWNEVFRDKCTSHIDVWNEVFRNKRADLRNMK